MKIRVKEKMVFVEMRDTKNDDYKVLIFGAGDFSGTINFVVNVNDFEIDFADRDLVEVEFSFQLGNRKVGNDYLELVNNRRLLNLKKVQ